MRCGNDEHELRQLVHKLHRHPAEVLCVIFEPPGHEVFLLSRLLLDNVLGQDFLTMLIFCYEIGIGSPLDLAGQRLVLIRILALTNLVNGFVLHLVKLIVVFRDELLPMIVSFVVLRVHVH